MFGGFSSNSSGDEKPMPQFVAGNYSGASDSDDGMCGDDFAMVLCRSTPSPNFAVPVAVRAAEVKEETIIDDDDMMPRGVEFAAPNAVNMQVSPVLMRTAEETRMVNKQAFSSISDVFPLSKVGKASVGLDKRPSFTMPETKIQPAASVPMSRLLNATPEMTLPDQMTVRVEVADTNGTVIKAELNTVKEPENAPIMATAMPSDVYRYQATEVEENEMEQMRWNIQEQVFQRYFQLKQKHQEWGRLEEQDERVFFLPGTRRENIMAEKRFHDQAVRDAMGKGNASWVKDRRARFEEEVREFCREETRHKQELMLTRLEKISPFCKFPILGNRFLLIRLRGKGGNGEVWDVVDYANHKQTCALKLSTSIRHAQQEHFTHSKLNHPNIVQVGELPFLLRYQQQQYTAFTVASVQTDLQQIIEMFEFLDDLSALKVLAQLLSALKYLHEDMNIAHYDLKPSNILIDQNECVKLTDFDLTRSAKQPTSNSTVGTLRYLPPECFRPNQGGECDATAEKADMWMVGIVYCMMVTGKHPICSGKSSHEEVKAAMAQYNGELRYARPISDLSRWIFQGCLHPDPRCRPTASQLLVALETSTQQQQQQ